MENTVLVDCRFAATHSGLGRYTRELAAHLMRDHIGLEYIFLVRSAKESWIPAGSKVIPTDIAHYSMQEQTQLPEIIHRSGAKVFFSPHFNVPFRCPLPFVVTIHDLILHRYPNQAPLHKQLLYRLLIRRAVKRAESVIAISNFVKDELTQVYGSSVSGKITVVTEGVSHDYHPRSLEEQLTVRTAYNLERPFILYVGNAKQHKNVPLLLEAYTRSGIQKELVLVTGGVELERLGALPPGVRTIAGIPEEHLPVLYSAADAFVTASLYEGYCLPVAEALACGCPVIASNRSAIPETANGHAVLVEPTVDAFATAMYSLPAQRDAYIAGRWDDTARRTADVLRKVMKAHKKPPLHLQGL